jgi:hypothetical protein
VIASSYNYKSRLVGNRVEALSLTAKTSSGEEKGPAAATVGPGDNDFTGCALRRSVSHGETTRRTAGLSTFLSSENGFEANIPIFERRVQKCVKRVGNPYLQFWLWRLW